MENNERGSARGPAGGSSRGTSRRTFLGRTFGSVVGAGLLGSVFGPSDAAEAKPWRTGREKPWSIDEFPTLQVGVGKVDVTPGMDVPLWGFAAREGPAEGTYLNMAVRAMTLDDGENRAAIISGEFLYWSEEVIDSVRAQLRERHGLTPEQIILNATHTHCGPVLSHEAYREEVTGKTVALVGDCLSNQEEARLYFGRGKTDFAASRRAWDRDGYVGWEINPYGPVDHEVVVVKAVSAAGDPIGVLFNYACHPTTTADKLFGGDFAGYAMEFIEGEMDGAVALFLQGCGGDQKPLNRREEDPYKFSYDGGPEKCSYFGRKLSDAALEVLDREMKDITGPLRTSRETVDLPLLARTIEKEGEPPLAAPDRRLARLAQLTVDALDEHGNYDEYRTCEVYVMEIGDEYVQVGLNGEICVPFGLQIKGRLVRRPVMVTAYTGPSVGYIPGMGQIPGKGYEAGVPYSPEAEDFLVGKVMEMVS